MTFVELGCPARLPDEWISATHWVWNADIPYERPLQLNPASRQVDVTAVGIAGDPMIHILRAAELATGETLVVTLWNGPYVSSITACVWPSADAANAAIHDELDGWADRIGLQTHRWTTSNAA
jgi:hypothetical protein